MRATRNRATKAIKRALKEGRRPDGTGIVEIDRNNPVIDTFADTGEQLVFLASRSRESAVVLPRCAGIMAQHYFDVLEFIGSTDGECGALWIFDFNRLSEASRVALGAEATTIMHTWPSETRVKIANCVFDPTTHRPPLIHVTRHG